MSTDRRVITVQPPSHHEAETTPALSRPSAAAEAISRLLGEERPERIGPYRILQTLGQGGMGLVYLAQRDDTTYAQRVALKVIRRGMDTDDILRRFELERKLLSALNHPNIARLVDGGQTEDGRPYFALEYIEGMPIEKYCDTHQLGLRERLALFQKVCSAVHYAHQNLIVHRDLKPGNVLVTSKGEPKLLDFGIAKLLNPALFEVEAVTGPAVRLMTPEYASPEQVRGDAITTASDIYSLGVMLYELLTGRRPYKFKTRLQHEIMRIVCEQSPEKPSTVISRIDEEPVGEGKTRRVDPESVAVTRGADIDKLRRRLRGDIDDIVLKALEKTPTRRYTSAEQLSEDISRHLAGEPVIARPPSLGYRVGKFVSRNKGPVAAAASISVALILGVAGTSIQWRRAEAARGEAVILAAAERRERQRADENADAERLQRAAAEEAKEKTDAAYADMWKLAVQFIDQIHPAIVKLPGAVAARDVLVTTAADYLTKLEPLSLNDPDRRLELSGLYERLGTLHSDARSGNKGDVTRALEFQRTGLKMRQALADAEPANQLYKLALASSHIRIADMLRKQRDLTAAGESYTQARTILETLDGDKPENSGARLRLAATLAALADLEVANGRLAAARPMLEKADQLRAALVALDASQQARRNRSVGLIDLASLSSELGDHAAAEAGFKDALAIRRQLLSEAPEESRTRRDLSVALTYGSQIARHAGDPALALQRATEARDLMQKLTAQEKDSPDDRSLQSLARAALAMGEALLAAQNPPADTLDSAGRVFASAGELLATISAAAPDDAGKAISTVRAHIGAGRVQLARGAAAEAVESFDRAAKAAARVLDEAPGDLITLRLSALAARLLGDAHAALNAADPARQAYERALTAARAVAATELPPAEPEAAPGAITAALNALPRP
ncbi:MAG: protein kinase [Planctomycetota bacterium]|nr:protein kinase [Planctomycetota bacterium]